jgi:NAD(P)-dependent dehydrogenase (short-subunit alcohol dehydrogenase family)
MGRHAVVTGAASGIGAATLAEFSRAGATVLGLDLAPAAPPVVRCDVADIESLPAVADRVIAELDGVDILVNCAGAARREPVTDLTWPAYDLVLRTNLHAPVFLMSLFGRHMAGRGYGRIVNVTSTHARATNAMHSAYSISKAGLDAATRAFAIELGGRGVLVNAVAPGFVATGMNPRAKLDTDWFRTTFVDSGQVPLGRYAEPDEIARQIACLAGDANSYLTGQSIAVDGGLTITVPPTAG